MNLLNQIIHLNSLIQLMFIRERLNSVDRRITHCFIGTRAHVYTFYLSETMELRKKNCSDVIISREMNLLIHILLSVKNLTYSFKLTLLNQRNSCLKTQIYYASLTNIKSYNLLRNWLDFIDVFKNKWIEMKLKFIEYILDWRHNT